MVSLRPLVLLVCLFVSFCAFGLVPGPERPMSDAAIEPPPGGRDTPRIASNGGGFLTVWTDRLTGIRAARISGAGHVLDPSGIHIGASVETSSVASDGRDYVVAYGCGIRQVCLALVRADSGEVVPSGTVERAAQPALASNGSGYMLAYVTAESYGSQNNSMEVMALGRDGRVVSAPTRLGSAVYPAAIASNGTDYFAAWSTYRNLEVALVAPGAEALRRETVAGRASAGPGMFSWDVASDGRDFLLAFQQNDGLSGGGYVSSLRTRLVSPAGMLGESRVITVPSTAWDPAIAWTGSGYVVTFSGESGATKASSLLAESDGDLYSVSLTRGGETAGPVEVVAADPGLEHASDVASTGGTTVAVWRRAGATTYTAQIKARVLGEGDPFFVSRRPAWQQSVAGARVGTHNILLWEEIVADGEQSRVYLQRVDAAGNPLDGRGVAVRETQLDQVEPAIGGSMIAWVEQERSWSPDAAGTVWAQWLAADGLPIHGTLVRVGSAARDSRVSIATLKNEHLIVWVSPADEIVAVRVLPTGTVLHPPVVVASSPLGDWAPAVATDGERYLVVWNQNEPKTWGCVMGCPPYASVQAALVTVGGTPSSPVQIAPGRLDASGPHLVWNGAEYAAFSVGRDPLPYGTQPAIRGRRLSPSGIPKDEGVDIGEGHYLGGAAWTGQEYVVAASRFASQFELSIRRLNGELQPVGTSIVTRQHMPPDVVLLFGEGQPPFIAYRRDVDGISRVVGRLLVERADPRRRISGR